MLPRYRGSYSIPWAILNNDPEIGVTLHDMTPSMDAGAIIRQEHIPNDPGKSCRDLYDDAVDIGADLVVWFVEQMLDGAAPAGVPQDEKLATYYPPDYPGEFKVPWRQTVTYVANYIRAAHFPPYDGAFGEIDEQRIVFDWPVEFQFDTPTAPPGTILTCNARPGVTALNGLILPAAVSVNGRRMDFGDLVSEHALLNHSFVEDNGARTFHHGAGARLQRGDDSWRRRFARFTASSHHSQMHSRSLSSRAAAPTGQRRHVTRSPTSFRTVVVVHEGSRNGFGAALRLGFAKATKDLIWVIPVDLPYSLSVLTRGA